MNLCFKSLALVLMAQPMVAESPSTPAQAKTDGSSNLPSAPLPIVENTDTHLCRQLYWMIENNERTEFIALVNLLRSTGLKSDLSMEVLSKAVAHPDSLYLLVLLKAGLMDVNARDRHKNSVGLYIFQLPVKRGREQLERLRLLVQCGYKPQLAEMLVEAAIRNSTEMVRELDEISGGKLDVNVSSFGTTPLIEAIKAGSQECVHTLLARNAHIQARDSNGKTAVDYAKEDLPFPNKPGLSPEEKNAVRVAIRKAVLEKLK